MTGGELRAIRLEMGYAPRDMYRELGLPRRTYQDYEAGKRGIPKGVADQARDLLQRDREFMARLPGRITEIIDRDFPGGIQSAVEPDLNED